MDCGVFKFGRIYNSFISYTFLRAHSSMGAYFIYKRLLQHGLSALPLPTLRFRFCLTTKKSKLEELPMKEINLRDYYPFYTQDMIVEVPDEVADLLREYKLAEAAYILRTYRHKAYFSLDYDASVERDALVIVLTPAEILEQKEENARLYQALASLPEKQRNRITSHFLLGMSISEIAKSEGSGVSSVHEGIQRGLRRLKKVLEKMETNPENNAKK